MARAGIYKSEVQQARDALLAQGRRPSIDAVRAELGHTGSKTTIHRYLKELEDEDGAAPGRDVAVSEAIQDLVGRLAARLHEEAAASITELQARHAEQLNQRDEAIAKLEMARTGLGEQLRCAETVLQAEQSALEQTRLALQALTVQCAQQGQQVTGLKERLTENEAHRQSLEDKHRHAREALEHYRASVKEQREQEQRRHEQQVQQLQAELRTLNQTVIVKQNELTHAYQDAARYGAELAAARKELRRSEQDAEKAGKARDALQARATQLEASMATLTERLQQVSTSRAELWLLLQDRPSPALAPNHAASQQQGDKDASAMTIDEIGASDESDRATPYGFVPPVTD